MLLVLMKNCIVICIFIQGIHDTKIQVNWCRLDAIVSHKNIKEQFSEIVFSLSTSFLRTRKCIFIWRRFSNVFSSQIQMTLQYRWRRWQECSDSTTIDDDFALIHVARCDFSLHHVLWKLSESHHFHLFLFWQDLSTLSHQLIGFSDMWKQFLSHLTPKYFYASIFFLSVSVCCQ